MLQSGAPGAAARQQSCAIRRLDGGLTWRRSPRRNPDGRVQGDDVDRVRPRWDGVSHLHRVRRHPRGPARARVERHLRSVARKDGLTVDAAGAQSSITSTRRCRSRTSRGSASIAAPARRIAATSTSRGRASTCTAAPIPRTAATSGSRARATAGGRSQPPLEISDDTGDAKDSDGTVEGAVPAVGPERRGVRRVGRAEGSGRSTSPTMAAGRSGRTSLIGALPGGWDLPVPGLERHNGMPVTAVDLSDGPESRARCTST